MYSKEQELLNYACKKFEAGAYDEALEAFALAYQRGYEREWILKNIYDCYMQGNQQTFRDAYEKSAGDGFPYEDCLLDFIPYREGEYFIFDKKDGIFRRTLSANAWKETKSDAVFEKMEFSPVALAINWDWREKMSIITEARERNVYMVCRDVGRCMSFFKIPEWQEYNKNIMVFSGYQELQKYFHEHISIYLPKVFCGDDADQMEMARIQKEEHHFRLTPQGRNKDNVLLTIAIPTAHRGNLLQKRMDNLLEMPFDSEVEIVVSKNCNDLYEEEYRKVASISDARLYYYDHNRDLEGHQNFHYAVKMSSGKYVVLVSDEDDVDISALEHYLKILKCHPNLAVIRAKSSKQGIAITEREYGRKGLEAFNLMFLGQNYISGLIVKRREFIEENFPEKLQRYFHNVFFQYYPHEWWCAFLCMKGDALKEPVTLVYEGEPANSKNQGILPEYSTYEARLTQFWGEVEFLQFMMQDNIEGCEIGLWNMIRKTAYLFELARMWDYDSTNYATMADKYASDCIKAIEMFPFDDEQKIKLLKCLQYCCMEMFAVEENLEKEKAEQEEQKGIKQ